MTRKMLMLKDLLRNFCGLNLWIGMNQSFETAVPDSVINNCPNIAPEVGINRNPGY